MLLLGQGLAVPLLELGYQVVSRFLVLLRDVLLAWLVQFGAEAQQLVVDDGGEVLLPGVLEVPAVDRSLEGPETVDAFNVQAPRGIPAIVLQPLLVFSDQLQIFWQLFSPVEGLIGTLQFLLCVVAEGLELVFALVGVADQTVLVCHGGFYPE